MKQRGHDQWEIGEDLLTTERHLETHGHREAEKITEEYCSDQIPKRQMVIGAPLGAK